MNRSRRHTSTLTRGLFAVAALGVLVTACAPLGPQPEYVEGDTSFVGSSTGDGAVGGDLVVDSSCIQVPMAVSSEKISLLRDLAAAFNDGDQAVLDGQCIAVNPATKSSGAASRLLAQGWPAPDANGVPPVIWSPAGSAWAAITNERAKKTIAPAGVPFMLTPLVIAMPQPMAEALGWPNTPVGFKDLVALANNPEGWASVGHPEWGPFRLGKTNPNYSTSGLNFTIAEYYAATGKTSGLTSEDLQRPEAQQFAANVESAVVHYGDITMTFLNNWFAADERGTSLTYASAVAVEEKSVIDYNTGNPDGVLAPGEVPRKPRIPLVAIYPSEGTLYSDNPFIILDADWVTPEQKAAAKLFQDFVQLPENQAKVLEYGFRPNNPAVPVGAPIDADHGVDPNQPQAELQLPSPDVLTKVLDQWAIQRKAARVLIVLDVSGSMGDPGSDAETKLDLAKKAAVSALSQFKDEDEVGLWIFSTSLSGTDADYAEVVPVAPIGPQRDALAKAIEDQFPQNGTPLYIATGAAYKTMLDSYNPADINAVVLLTDGVNDDETPADDADQFRSLIDELQAGSEGATSRPVRVFTISYGADADTATLKAIASATAAAHYDASNPETIEQVFTAVISNF